MAITLTESAAGEIQRIMESQNLEEGTVLRMGIGGGGCSGLQYSLGFDNQFDPSVDTRFEQHGVPLVASKKFALHLDGTTIDFQDGPMGRGFAIDNPNYPTTGGCPGCGGG
ncbi:MAG: HesB/IscA family protein [Planctomycetota bacterium]|jgi:iron-sulfur cluster assembly protein